MKAATAERRTAVGYVRVSSKEQLKEGFSIPAQRQTIEAYASDQHLLLEKWFEDDETAKTTGRTAFGDMLRYLRAHPTVRIILVEKTDRLYRNPKDWVVLDDLGVEIHFVKEGAIASKTSRSSEKFMHGIRVLMAKQYVDNLSEEVKKGLDEKARQGLFPGKPPFGYVSTRREDGKVTIIPDPERASIVTRLFSEYASGHYSIKRLRKVAAEHGLRYRKSREPITKSTIYRLLRNRVYTGDFTWRGTLYRGTHEPLVTMAVFDRVQRILDEQAGRPRGTRRHHFLFTGLLRCGGCGGAMVGDRKKGRYSYYFCTGNRGCERRYIREERIDERVTQALALLTIPDDVQAWLEEDLAQATQDDHAARAAAIQALQHDKERLTRRLDAIYDDKLDGRIPADLFERKAASIIADQRRLDEQLANLSTEPHDTKATRTVFELAKTAARRYETQTTSEKRTLLQLVCSNSTWKDDALDVAWRQPYALLALANQQGGGATGPTGPDFRESEIWRRVGDSNPR